jgi:hypothetical protein
MTEATRWTSLPFCACGCGKQVRVTKYHSDCANECKCGCGGRARYAYKPGHRPETVCQRCGKIFKTNSETGTKEMCSQCRRHIRDGGPIIRDESLAFTRRMQSSSPEGRRWCSGCEQYRLLKFFASRGTKGGPEGYYARCRPCHTAQLRATTWKRKFGIDPEQYEQIKDLQGGRCAICQIANGTTKALAIDHDHKHCGKGSGCSICIRGLLCSNCNNMLGFARDNPEMFQRAVEYLLDPPARKLFGSRLP